MNKTQLRKIKKAILKKETLAFDQLTKKQKVELFEFSERYKKFLDQSKTEREAAKQIVHAAKNKGFVDIDSLAIKNTK
ncbi:MAG TPA: aminopeptidase, partial [Desulfobacterales bacterium]|nr:aminopeptidase [Desulfobacterales bacterium]